MRGRLGRYRCDFDVPPTILQQGTVKCDEIVELDGKKALDCTAYFADSQRSSATRNATMKSLPAVSGDRPRS